METKLKKYFLIFLKVAVVLLGSKLIWTVINLAIDEIKFRRQIIDSPTTIRRLLSEPDTNLDLAYRDSLQLTHVAVDTTINSGYAAYRGSNKTQQNSSLYRYGNPLKGKLENLDSNNHISRPIYKNVNVDSNSIEKKEIIFLTIAEDIFEVKSSSPENVEREISEIVESYQRQTSMEFSRDFLERLFVGKTISVVEEHIYIGKTSGLPVIGAVTNFLSLFGIDVSKHLRIIVFIVIIIVTVWIGPILLIDLFKYLREKLNSSRNRS